jgi:hypothetical protein
MTTGEARRSGSKSGMKVKSMVSTAVLKVRAPFVSSWAERRDCSCRLC